MELSDEITIPAGRDQVYACLNDPAVLKECIPGCEELSRLGEDEMEALVTLKIGPMKAKFKGKVRLDRKGAPAKFRLHGEGDGGVAGFAKGGADVELTEDGGNTILKYTATAEPGGKIAQLGSRLIMGTAKKLAGKFFDNFEDYMAKQG